VDTTWRPELAYAVGLITADGSLSKDGRHIDFTSKDVDQIETYLRCLEIEDIKIGQKYSGGGNREVYYRAQFGDVLFYTWLQDIGLSSNKSLIINSLKIPNKYFFDFVRGEWDGDGTVYCRKDFRWKDSYIVCISFASGSEDFLTWLHEEINIRLGTTGHIYSGKRVLQLRYGRKDSRKLFDAMFYEDGLPHLHRKFAKAEKIFRMTGL
jgi:hypothetical protein